MRIEFLGAAREVTGSRLLLHLPGGTVLVDCGMFQGRRQESRDRNAHLPRKLLEADAVVLTHAHVDHAGSLPTLVKRGFTHPIYATHATRSLAAQMLRDSGRIQTADAEYLNRQFQDQPGYVPIEPIYDEEDALAALERFVGLGYHTPFEPVPGCRATFYDAGHILGSAEVLFEVDVGGGRPYRLLVSGDLGRSGLPILRDPEVPGGRFDAVVLESTYGDRLHAPVEQMHDAVEKVIRDTMARGGRVVVPAFALGRTQELLYVLRELHTAGRLPDIPVFIDSPLATSVTEVFRAHPECYDKPTRKLLEEGDPFSFPGLTFVTSREDSMALNTRPGPAIVIAASGMAEAGRVLHHLKYAIEDRRNTVLIVGFMAQHTLGRRLVERRPRVRILGMEYDNNADVVVLNGFSAHADRDDLLRFADATCGRRTYLVHGEPDQQDPLAQELRRRGLDVVVPEPGSEHPLT